MSNRLHSFQKKCVAIHHSLDRPSVSEKIKERAISSLAGFRRPSARKRQSHRSRAKEKNLGILSITLVMRSYSLLFLFDLLKCSVEVDSNHLEFIGNSISYTERKGKALSFKNASGSILIS